MKLMNNILMVDRSEFDYSNIKQVTENNFFELENIINIENDILITDKNRYRFKYIIFADVEKEYIMRYFKEKQLQKV